MLKSIEQQVADDLKQEVCEQSVHVSAF